MAGNLGGRGLEHQLATGMPEAAMVPLAAQATGHPWPATPIGRFEPATRTAGDPARRLAGHGEAMPNAHLKRLLRPIDGGHARAEVGPVHLIGTHHPMHPGMNHLVAERAGCGLLRQGF